MDLKYKLTRTEFQEMGLRERQRHGKLRKSGLFFTVYMGFVAFLATFAAVESLIAAVMVASLALLCAHFLYRRMQRNGLGRVYDLTRTNEETQVRLDAAGLYLAREHIRSEIDWEAITAVTEDEIGFYLTYAPLQSVWVPRRVFANAAQAQQFWTMVQEYRQFASPVGEKTAVRVG